MTPTPLPATTALDAGFLEARARLLDLAATLDRIDRGTGAAGVTGDPRLEKIRRALAVLGGAGPDRAAAVQEIFSLPYNPSWVRPVAGSSPAVNPAPGPADTTVGDPRRSPG